MRTPVRQNGSTVLGAGALRRRGATPSRLVASQSRPNRVALLRLWFKPRLYAGFFMGGWREIWMRTPVRQNGLTILGAGALRRRGATPSRFVASQSRSNRAALLRLWF